jgi:hypothetical protein
MNNFADNNKTKGLFFMPDDKFIAALSGTIETTRRN